METIEKNWKFNMPNTEDLDRAWKTGQMNVLGSETGDAFEIYEQAVAALKERLVATDDLAEKAKSAGEIIDHSNALVKITYLEKKVGVQLKAIDELEDEVEGLEGTFAGVQRSRDRWKERAEGAETTLRAERKALEAQQDGGGQSRAHWQQRAKNLEMQLASTIEECDKQEKRADKAEAEIVRLGEVRTVKDFNLTASIGALSHNLEKAEARVSELADQNTALLLKSSLKESGMEGLEASISMGRASLSNKVEYLEQTVRGQLKIIEDLKRENASAEASIDCGQDHNVRQSEKIVGLEAELNDYKNRLAQAVTRTVKAELEVKENARFKGDNEVLNQANDELKAAMDTAIEQREEYRRILSLNNLTQDQEHALTGMIPHVKSDFNDPRKKPCDPTRKLRFGEEGQTWEMCLPRKVGP